MSVFNSSTTKIRIAVSRDRGQTFSKAVTVTPQRDRPLVGWAGPWLRSAGGPVLLGVLGLVVLTGFWWFTSWFLLGSRISWPDVFPAAVATAVFWLGMEEVFSVIFSGMVTSDNQVRAIGVVFALMSWLIAIGVVIILGAVATSCGSRESVVPGRRQEIAAGPERAGREWS